MSDDVASAGERQRRQVLVIEDDEDVRDAIAAALADERFDPLCASDGREALGLLSQSEIEPGLIVLDLMLPLMNGTAFAAAIRNDERRQRIPIIVVSADPDAHEISRAIGAVGVLPKPFEAQRFTDLVRRTYRQAREHREAGVDATINAAPLLKILVIDESERGLRDAANAISAAGHEVVGMLGLLGIGAALGRESPDVVLIGPSIASPFHARLAALLRARGATCVIAASYDDAQPADDSLDGGIAIRKGALEVDRVLRAVRTRRGSTQLS